MTRWATSPLRSGGGPVMAGLAWGSGGRFGLRMLIPPAMRSRLRSSTEPTMLAVLAAGTTMVSPSCTAGPGVGSGVAGGLEVHVVGVGVAAGPADFDPQGQRLGERPHRSRSSSTLASAASVSGQDGEVSVGSLSVMVCSVTSRSFRGHPRGDAPRYSCSCPLRPTGPRTSWPPPNVSASTSLSAPSGARPWPTPWVIGPWSCPWPTSTQRWRPSSPCMTVEPLDAVLAVDDQGWSWPRPRRPGLGLTHNPHRRRGRHPGQGRHAGPLGRRLGAPARLPGRLRRARAWRPPRPRSGIRAWSNRCRVRPAKGSSASMTPSRPRRPRPGFAPSSGPGEPLLVEALRAGSRGRGRRLCSSGGGLEVLAVFDKPDPLDGPFFEETIYVTPSRQPAAILAAMRPRWPRRRRPWGCGRARSTPSCASAPTAA